MEKVTSTTIVRVLRIQEWIGTRESIAAQVRRSLPDGQQWVDKNGHRIGGPNGSDHRGTDMRQGDLLINTTTLQPWGGQPLGEILEMADVMGTDQE